MDHLLWMILCLLDLICCKVTDYHLCFIFGKVFNYRNAAFDQCNPLPLLWPWATASSHITLRELSYGHKYFTLAIVQYVPINDSGDTALSIVTQLTTLWEVILFQRRQSERKSRRFIGCGCSNSVWFDSQFSAAVEDRLSCLGVRLWNYRKQINMLYSNNWVVE